MDQILKNHALNLVQFVKTFDKLNDNDKKEWCTEQLTIALELFDDKIPVIGKIMDFQIVDGMEKRTVRQLINWAFLKIESESKSTTSDIEK